jgi:murein DD-endopeptidase MepM/ murein hydrolase activator NlpD
MTTSGMGFPCMPGTGMLMLIASAALLLTPSCPPQPRPRQSDGTSYVVRLEAPGGLDRFLKVGTGDPTVGPSDAGASFVLFDLDRGELKSGDEVLLLNTRQDSYLRGGAVGARVTTAASGPSSPGSGPIGFCNIILVVEAEGGGQATLANGANVRLRVFTDACASPRDPGGFISAPPSGGLSVVAGPPTASETFILRVDRVEPYTITRGLSAPFASTNHFYANNLMDLDWHNGVMRDYRGNSPARTYDNHNGIDFDWAWPGFRAMQEGGAAVLAVAPGKVVYVREDREDRCHAEKQDDGSRPIVCPPDSPRDTDRNANDVIIRHDDGTASVYTHLMKDSVPVSEGDNVRCGQLIGRVGSAGTSSHPHLHFELRRPHDPDFWTKNPGGVRYPHFWDHSTPVDPYEVGAWKRFGDTPPGTPPGYQFIPLVTCENDANRRLAREGEDIFLRSQLARGYLFDRCDGNPAACGDNYYCGRKDVCERRVAAGGPCTSGDQCPPLHGCQNGVCRVGPNCTDKCPPTCFTDAEGRCKTEVPERVREDCQRDFLGNCPSPICFVDAQGACKTERPTGKKVREDCALVCLP